MIYAITINRSAQRQLAKIDAQMRIRISQAIYAFAENPRPSDCKKLVGHNAWRIRIGSYRVIYEIQDNILVVTVIRVVHRREVYR